MTRCAHVVLLLCFALTPARAEELALVQFTDTDGTSAGWQPLTVKEGVTLERRPVTGSRYYEHRAVVELPVDPQAAAEDIWRALRNGDMDALKRREILREGPSELLVYDQIRAPVVSDRDYVIEVKRSYDPSHRRTQFRCWTVEGVGPPVARGHVRIPLIRAGWMVEPGFSGGTRLTYFAYAEPGGYITAFMARGAQADRSMSEILHMAQRLRRLGH